MSSHPVQSIKSAGIVPVQSRRWNDAFSYWAVVVAWMVLISVFSTEPFSASNTNRYIDPLLRYLFPHLTHQQFLLAHTVIRKTAHFVEFFVLGCLTYWACRRGRAPRLRGAWMAQAMALAIVYSLVDEVHQAFVPGRTSSFADSAIDTLGAAVSQLMIYFRHAVLPRLMPSR